MREQMSIMVLCALVLGLFPWEAASRCAAHFSPSAVLLRSLSHSEKKSTKATPKKTQQRASQKQKLSVHKPSPKAQAVKPQSAKASAKQLEKLRKDIAQDRTKLRDPFR